LLGILFLALETAFEDAVVSVVLPLYAKQLGGGDETYGNLMSNLMTAAGVLWSPPPPSKPPPPAGKFGAVIAAVIMHRKWTPGHPPF
jgi:hypothetical protein